MKRNLRIIGKFALAFAAILGLVLAGASASATSVTPTDLGTITLGALYAGPLTTPIKDGPPEPWMGNLTGNVYLNGGTYTYTFEVDPRVNNISSFGTAFGVAGFTGVAGYSFANADTASSDGDRTALGRQAGSPGAGLDTATIQLFDPLFTWDPAQAFDIDFDNISSTLSWDVPFLLQLGDFWRNLPDTIDPNLCTICNLTTMTFFYQSTLPPGLKEYNLINLHVGIATNFAPVPEPMTLLLLGSGLAGTWFAGRRQKSKRD